MTEIGTFEIHHHHQDSSGSRSNPRIIEITSDKSTKKKPACHCRWCIRKVARAEKLDRIRRNSIPQVDPQTSPAKSSKVVVCHPPDSREAHRQHCVNILPEIRKSFSDPEFVRLSVGSDESCDFVSRQLKDSPTAYRHQSTVLGRSPEYVTCPNCLACVKTKVSRPITLTTHLTAIALIPICLCLLPYWEDIPRDSIHSCPHCNAYMGKYFASTKEFFSDLMSECNLLPVQDPV